MQERVEEPRGDDAGGYGGEQVVADGVQAEPVAKSARPLLDLFSD
ncbi:hypothetical protein [Bifidobacterium aquikefiri]|nr:hypothetical protein [Bifidobacterium aquikefiri]